MTVSRFLADKKDLRCFKEILIDESKIEQPTFVAPGRAFIMASDLFIIKYCISNKN